MVYCHCLFRERILLRFLCAILFGFICAINPVMAAPEKLSGIVYEQLDDGKKQPLVGATVVVQETSIWTTTTLDGSWELNGKNLPNDAVLEFSFLGYELQTITVKGGLYKEVIMKGKPVSIETVVATGCSNGKVWHYGEMAKNLFF